jgi:hypothetical protein
MQCGEGVLEHGLDRHRQNLLVPVGLEQRFAVGTIILASSSIRLYEMRREKNDRMPEASELPRPEVSRAACLDEHGRRRSFREERHQLGSTHTMLLGYLTRLVGDGDFEDVLCKIHADRRMVHSDSSFSSRKSELTLAHRCRSRQQGGVHPITEAHGWHDCLPHRKKGTLLLSRCSRLLLSLSVIIRT